MKYDYLIVGAGLFGAVMARELTNARKHVLVIEKNSYSGGMCYTKEVGGITVQMHGGHIYHTNDKRLWDYVNRYAIWRQYSHHVKANFDGVVYSMPINFMTLQQLYGNGWRDMARWIVEQTPQGESVEDWAVSSIGRKAYLWFIKGYTRKQWGKDPRELPASIIKRLPVRMSWNDEYFSDEFQGLPVGGYQSLFDNLLGGIAVEYGRDYIDRATYWDNKAAKTIYTGPLDLLYGKCAGALDYRSLRFEHERKEVKDYQGCPTMNYTNVEVPFTRIHEHKHWYPANVAHTMITREYPAAYDGTNEPYYPINDAANTELHKRYIALAESRGLIIGGRMATYRYIDMHQCVASALTLSKQLIGESDNGYKL